MTRNAPHATPQSRHETLGSATRRLALAIGVAFALPAAAASDAFFVTTNDEAGSRIVQPPVGSIAKTPVPAGKPLAIGDLSNDREWIYRGGDAGWELRPMTYRLSGGRLVHVDDPEGHMHRLADTRPATASELEAQKRSGGQ